MGAKARRRPERLGEKLLQVRTALGLSQTELLKLLKLEDTISYKKISDYERGEREPTTLILLKYARVAGVHVEDLINDKVDLPEKLPGRVRHVT